MRLICWLRGHDECRLSIGPNYVDTCLRCRKTLHIHEEGK